MGSRLSAEAARKRIQRARGIARVWLKFPHNDRLLHLPRQFHTEAYFDALTRALRASGSAYGVALDSIIARGGVIPSGHFSAISGSPLRLRKHVASTHVLANLEKLELLSRETLEGIGEVLVIRGFHDPSRLHSLRARLIAEDILLTYFADWLRKVSLVSWGTTKRRTGTAAAGFGQHEWDLSAPSYVHPFKSIGKGRPSPGFVVADVLLGKKLERNEVQYFIRKCASLRAQRAIRPFMAFLIASGFAKDAMQAGKQAGLIFVTPQTIFGSDIGEALARLLDNLINASAAAKDPTAVTELFAKLSAIEGAAANLRGPMFELIAAHLISTEHAGTIEIGNIVRDPEEPTQTAEIDVLLDQGRSQVRVIECKGKLGNLAVTSAEAKKWLTERVPVIRRWLLSQRKYANARFSFELWTTGKYEPEALAFLNQQQQVTQKFAVAWKNGAEVLDLARKLQASSIIKTLNEHYLKHPLAAQDLTPCT